MADDVPTKNTKSLPSKHDYFGCGVLASCVFLIFLSWLAWWYFIPKFYQCPAQQGQLGDMFGGLNVMFSGLTAAILVYTVWLQIKQQRALQTSIHGQFLVTVFNILQNEDIRYARRVVLSQLKDKNYVNWSEIQTNLAVQVVHTFDTVGMMVNRELLPIDFVAEGWNSSIVRCWDVLSQYVKELRRCRSAPEIGEYFENLVERCRPLKADRFPTPRN